MVCEIASAATLRLVVPVYWSTNSVKGNEYTKLANKIIHHCTVQQSTVQLSIRTTVGGGIFFSNRQASTSWKTYQRCHGLKWLVAPTYKSPMHSRHWHQTPAFRANHCSAIESFEWGSKAHGLHVRSKIRWSGRPQGSRLADL